MIHATDDRAVSTAVSYVLVLGIAAILVGGLVVGTTSLVEEQQTEVVRERLTVIGHELAGTVTTVSRLSATDTEPSRAAIERDFSTRVANSQYRIRVVDENANAIPGDGPGPSIVLESVDFDVTVRVAVRTATDPRTGDPVEVETGYALNGGPVEVVYNPATSPGRVEIRND